MLASCSKKEEDAAKEVMPEPVIGYAGLAPLEVMNFNNSVKLTISYADNNGDIGFDDHDLYSLSVKDSRLDSADWYHIAPLAPLNANIVISGKLDIVLNSLFILGNGNEEKVSLTVKLRDRANHWSNIITTPAITIKR